MSRKKYKTPGEHLAASKRPKTPEHAKRIKEGMSAYWARAREEYDEMRRTGKLDEFLQSEDQK